MACVVKYSEIFGGESMSARGRQLLAVQLRGMLDWEIIGLGYLPVGPKRGVHLVDHVADGAIRADFAPDIFKASEDILNSFFIRHQQMILGCNTRTSLTANSRTVKTNIWIFMHQCHPAVPTDCYNNLLISNTVLG